MCQLYALTQTYPKRNAHLTETRNDCNFSSEWSRRPVLVSIRLNKLCATERHSQNYCYLWQTAFH